MTESLMRRSSMLLIVASAGAGPAETLHVRVVGVHDGDTITALTDDKRQLKIRLHGIDAPGTGPASGQCGSASPRTAGGRHPLVLRLFARSLLVLLDGWFGQAGNPLAGVGGRAFTLPA
jgi:hypothetical protein